MPYQDIGKRIIISLIILQAYSILMTNHEVMKRYYLKVVYKIF